MRTVLLVLCLLVAVVAVSARLPPGGISVASRHQEIANRVNSNPDSTWVAGVNSRFIGMSPEKIRRQLGALKTPPELRLPIKEIEPLAALPTSFDAREHWSNCSSIGQIRDQSDCGSCWAFGAVEAATDRICIETAAEKTPMISANDLLACCTSCGYGCSGGYLPAAWAYLTMTGVVTGGNYNDSTSSEWCQKYSLANCDVSRISNAAACCQQHCPTLAASLTAPLPVVLCPVCSMYAAHQQHPAISTQAASVARCLCRPSHSLACCVVSVQHESGRFPLCSAQPEYPTPTCLAQCDSGSDYPTKYEKDLHKFASAYGIAADVKAIATEIYTNGPVEAAFTVYEDFLTYKSGVYSHQTGGVDGGHAIKIIGWGEEDSTPYWLVANSWNEDWGDKGFFKILRGKDECGIEDQVVAGKYKKKAE